MKKIIKFFNREQNLFIHIVATILVTIAGIIFSLNINEWLLIYLMVAFVITSELVNSSIELVVDSFTKEYNSLAKVAKDTAAGAVLVSAITALCVGIYIFLPKLLELIIR